MRGIIHPIDIQAVRKQYLNARPFPHFKIDNFLDNDFVREVAAAYPTYESARGMGKEFDAINEKLKVQVSDSSKFLPPVKALSDALSSSEFLGIMESITGVPKLLADPDLDGGGMHLTNTSGRLDVHVDFNFHEKQNAYRRLNILVYLNPVWEESWGGNIELWDASVTKCQHSFSPILNRCVVFETNDISFHGVTPLKCPSGYVRKSFAAYYYTKEAPAGWEGKKHSTIFKARPTESLRAIVLAPAESMARRVNSGVGRIKRGVSKLFGR